MAQKLPRAIVQPLSVFSYVAAELDHVLEVAVCLGRPVHVNHAGSLENRTFHEAFDPIAEHQERVFHLLRI